MSKFCRYCGAPLAENAKFCVKCGSPLPASAIVEASVTPEIKPEPVSSPAPAVSASPKEFFLGGKVYSFARSLVFYIAIGGTTIIWLIIGLAVGWTPWMFIPFLLLALSLTGYFAEINKISIDADTLAKWNQARAGNTVFKKPINNPNSFGAKLQFWHASFKPTKVVACVSTGAILFMYLPLIIGSSVRFATGPGGAASGGSGTPTRQYKGFWPNADYVVVFEPWTDHLVSIWDPVGLKRYENPYGPSVSFSIQAEYQGDELTQFNSLVVSKGYTLTDTGKTTVTDMSGNVTEYPIWYYEREWGPATTWQKHAYYCRISVKDQGYNRTYKVNEVIMEYMFFNYSGD